MHTREEIAAGLQQRFGEVVVWFAQRPDSKFCKGPVGRWTEGQHLDHLIIGTKPVTGALRMPRAALESRFGTAKSPGETMDALVARYEKLIVDGLKAPVTFVPPVVTIEDKPRLLNDFREEGQRLLDAAADWSESDLDKYVLPHPALGDLSIRNMLQFTYHHMRHHLDILKRDY